MTNDVILCGTDNKQPGDRPYFVGYVDMVDGYRHAWWDGKRMRRGRNFGHPLDARCPECAEKGKS